MLWNVEAERCSAQRYFRSSCAALPSARGPTPSQSSSHLRDQHPSKKRSMKTTKSLLSKLPSAPGTPPWLPKSAAGLAVKK